MLAGKGREIRNHDEFSRHKWSTYEFCDEFYRINSRYWNLLASHLYGSQMNRSAYCCSAGIVVVLVQFLFIHIQLE